MRGERRLKEIQRRLTGTLATASPEDAKGYEIRYQSMDDYYHETVGIQARVSPRDSPAYKFVLTQKGDPSKSVEIMQVFWPDISKPTPSHMKRYYGGDVWADKIRDGIKRLEQNKPRRSKPSQLEDLGIFFIVSAILGAFFLSGNLTGLTIFNLNQGSTNWVGASLLLVGIAGSFLLLKNKKDNSIPVRQK